MLITYEADEYFDYDLKSKYVSLCPHRLHKYPDCMDERNPELNQMKPGQSGQFGARTSCSEALWAIVGIFVLKQPE